jgi:hypothetical protein
MWEVTYDSEEAKISRSDFLPFLSKDLKNFHISVNLKITFLYPGMHP